MVHSTVPERTRQLDRKRKERSYWDPVRLLREISSLFPREMPGRLHIRGFTMTKHSIQSLYLHSSLGKFFILSTLIRLVIVHRSYSITRDKHSIPEDE